MKEPREYKDQKVNVEVFYCDTDFTYFYKTMEEAKRDCFAVSGLVNLSDYLDLQKENEALKDKLEKAKELLSEIQLTIEDYALKEESFLMAIVSAKAEELVAELGE